MKYVKENKPNRYTDALPKLVQNYNNSCHRSIKMTPIEASKEENECQVYKNLCKERVFKN